MPFVVGTSFSYFRSLRGTLNPHLACLFPLSKMSIIQPATGRVYSWLALFHAGSEVGRSLAPSFAIALGGRGGDGQCLAPGHEGAQPSPDDLREFCNLGDASKCSRLPVQRDCDAVRFGVARDQGSRLLLWFVCETGHRPGTHGNLEYDVDQSDWISTHPDARIQKMLECYVQSYLQRKMQPAIADQQPSTTL